MCQAAFPASNTAVGPGGGTVLLGEVAEQATLMRLLHRLQRLGLTLLRVSAAHRGDLADRCVAPHHRPEGQARRRATNSRQGNGPHTPCSDDTTGDLVPRRALPGPEATRAQFAARGGRQDAGTGS